MKKENEQNFQIANQCHITGKYRGCAHEIYNANYRLTQKTPVIFHNLRGYDHIMENNCYMKWSRNIYVFYARKKTCFLFTVSN